MIFCLIGRARVRAYLFFIYYKILKKLPKSWEIAHRGVLFPFDRRRRLVGYIIKDIADAFDRFGLCHDRAERLSFERDESRGHRFLRDDRPQDHAFIPANINNRQQNHRHLPDHVVLARCLERLGDHPVDGP